jgi:hypothetical protein
MSLSRLALRLAAIEALCPAATIATGPYPTIAGNRVDDSRIDLLAQARSPEDLDAALDALEDRPLLVVYTEEQHTAPYGTVKYDATENVVVLVVEAMIGAKGQIQIGENPDGSAIMLGALDAPVTDRQHEATLDLLESQVRFLFDPKQTAPCAELFRKTAWEIREIHSDPQRAADRTLRLAARTIKFHIKVRAEVWKAGAALPEPLASVAAALPAGSSGAALLAALAPFSPAAPATARPDRGAGFVITAPIDRPPNANSPPPGDVAAFVPATPPRKHP